MHRWPEEGDRRGFQLHDAPRGRNGPLGRSHWRRGSWVGLTASSHDPVAQSSAPGDTRVRRSPSWPDLPSRNHRPSVCPTAAGRRSGRSPRFVRTVGRHHPYAARWPLCPRPQAGRLRAQRRYDRFLAEMPAHPRGRGPTAVIDQSRHQLRHGYPLSLVRICPSGTARPARLPRCPWSKWTSCTSRWGRL